LGETLAPAQDEEERRHYQIAHGIAQPPGPPGLAKRSGRDHATEPATGHSDGGADQGTEHGRKYDQAQDIPEAVESGTEPDQALEEQGADQRFQRIPYRNPTRHRHWRAGPQIDEKSSAGDAGPEVTAPQDQGHQGNARWRPDGRGDTVYRI
jgi:hypothetical protein